MKKILFFLLLPCVLFGQDFPEEMPAAVAVARSVSVVDDTTLVGTLTGVNDVMGYGLRADSVQVGDKFIDAAGRIHTIELINSRGLNYLNVQVVTKDTVYFDFSGRGVLWRPDTVGLIPIGPAANGMVSDFLAAKIHNHNLAILSSVSDTVKYDSLIAGANITIDYTDPRNPVISSTGGGGSGTVESVVAGTGISVDVTDPANPIVTNISPDQAVSLNAGSNVTVSGTYPNFTITVPSLDDADADPTNELYDDSELRDSLAVHRTDIDALAPTVYASADIAYQYPSGDLSIETHADYHIGRESMPLLVLMHQYSGNSEDIAQETVDRFVDRGFFVLRPQMRGRTNSDGTADSGGNEIKDIVAAVDHALDAFPDLIDPKRIVVYGLSGGGGNALSAVTKYPFKFSLAVNYFGIGDYSLWHKENVSRQGQIEGFVGGDPVNDPELYEARNSIRAISNFPNPVLSFHDQDDATVDVKLTEELRDSSLKFNTLATVRISTSADASSERYFHNEASSVVAIENSESLWRPFVNEYLVPEQPGAGRLRVAGYVGTPLFFAQIDAGNDNAGWLGYDYSGDVPAFEFTPQFNYDSLAITAFGKDEIVVNGCTYPTVDGRVVLYGDRNPSIVEYTLLGSTQYGEQIRGNSGTSWNNVAITNLSLKEGKRAAMVFDSGTGFAIGGNEGSPANGIADGFTFLEYGAGHSASTGNSFFLNNGSIQDVSNVSFSAGDSVVLYVEDFVLNVEFWVGGAAVKTRSWSLSKNDYGVLEMTMRGVSRITPKLDNLTQDCDNNFIQSLSSFTDGRGSGIILSDPTKKVPVADRKHYFKGVNGVTTTSTADTTTIDGSAFVGGGGTDDYIPKWNSNSLEDSSLKEQGGEVISEIPVALENAAIVGRENLIRAKISDSNNFFGLGNGTSNGSQFLPTLYGYNTTNNRFALEFRSIYNPTNETTGQATNDAGILLRVNRTDNTADPLNGSLDPVQNVALLRLLNGTSPVFGIENNGNANFELNRATNIADPVDLQDAVTKAYFEANGSDGNGILEDAGPHTINEGTTLRWVDRSGGSVGRAKMAFAESAGGSSYHYWQAYGNNSRGALLSSRINETNGEVVSATLQLSDPFSRSTINANGKWYWDDGSIYRGIDWDVPAFRVSGSDFLNIPSDLPANNRSYWASNADGTFEYVPEFVGVSTSDQTLTAGGSIASDPEITVSGIPAGTYEAEVVLNYESSNINGELIWTFTTVGVDAARSTYRLPGQTNNVSSDWTVTSSTAEIITTNQIHSTGAQMGTIVFTSTGTVTLRRRAGATGNITLREGSRIRLKKID
jgi:dienelactone hydrolase